MTEHAKAILEKMRSSEYPELNFDFVFKLTNESERGAILVGASKVETYLENLILKILPSKQKSYTSRLLNYPGPLSSFSGKIELLYAFGVIDKKLYDSLTILRKIRNDAAHSNEEFSIQKIKDMIDKIYDFEYGFQQAIHTQSLKNLIKWKKKIIKQGLIDDNLNEHFDFEKLWDEKVPNPETHEAIQEQLTIWKLSYGLTLMCLKIEVIKDEYLRPCYS